MLIDKILLISANSAVIYPTHGNPITVTTERGTALIQALSFVITKLGRLTLFEAAGALSVTDGDTVPNFNLKAVA